MTKNQQEKDKQLVDSWGKNCKKGFVMHDHAHDSVVQLLVATEHLTEERVRVMERERAFKILHEEATISSFVQIINVLQRCQTKILSNQTKND